MRREWWSKPSFNHQNEEAEKGNRKPEKYEKRHLIGEELLMEEEELSGPGKRIGRRGRANYRESHQTGERMRCTQKERKGVHYTSFSRQHVKNRTR